jgi:phage protein D
MNLKLLSVISTSVAVFAIVMLLSRGCDKPNTLPDTTPWRERVESLEAQIRDRDSLIQEIIEKRHTDSVEHLRVTTGLKSREAALVRKLKAANADIQVIADSLPKVARYIELADSTIAVKDSLYTREVNHGISTEALYKSEIAAMADKYVKQVQVSEELTTVVTDLTNENSKLSKKLERKTRFNRVLIGVGAGLAAAIGILTLTQ